MKRMVIACAVLQGLKITEVARDLGVSRSWASREAHHPKTQLFIARLKKQDPETAVCSLQCALKGDRGPDDSRNRLYQGRKDYSRPYNGAACQSLYERGDF